jgi:hypothetical protein
MRRDCFTGAPSLRAVGGRGRCANVCACAFVLLKTECLPRRAWDKHRKSWKKETERRFCRTRFGRCDKTASFLEFSLCLSRACLSKMIIFISINGSKGPFFQVWRSLGRGVAEEEGARRGVRQRSPVFVFYTQNDHFAKTGSGQT